VLDGFVAWLTEAGGRVSFFVVPVGAQDKGFSWTDPGMIGAMIGAAASVLVAFAILMVTTFIEKGRRASDKAEFDRIRAEDQAAVDAERTEDRLRREAAGALNTYAKVSRYANSILAVKNAIDQRYADLDEDGNELENPSQIVGPIPGKFVVPERLKSEEFSFLFTKENFLVAGEIEDLESGCILMMSLVEEYTAMQFELQKWLDYMPGADRKIEGMIGSDEIPKAMEGGLNRRIAQMNILIVSIIEITEQKNPSPKEVMVHFIAAAVASPFGKYFPKMELV